MKLDLGSVEVAFHDEEQRKTMIHLFKQVENQVEDYVEKEVERRLQDAGFEGASEDDRSQSKVDKAYRVLDRIWRNNGRVNDFSEGMELEELFDLDKKLHDTLMQDAAFSSTDLPLLMPRVIEQQVREAIEPALNLTPLFQTIRFEGRGTRISFPSTGAIYAADIAEGAEYPSRKMEFAGSVTATVGKSGVAVRVTEEAIRYSLFDVIGLHVRAAGRALARHKENKAFDAINDNATVLLSNDSATVKSTTGRDAVGNHNGTLTSHDFLYAWSQLYNNNGYTPNTLIMNPFGWLAFAQDPLMRQFFMNTGNGSLFQLPQGMPGRATQWSQGGLMNHQQVTSPKNIATTYNNPPDLWPGSVRVIVSPYVTYNDSDNTTDIFMCDSNELGVLVEDEPVVMDQWEEPQRDISNMKFRERYAFATMNDGRAIGKIAGVSIARGFDFSDRITIDKPILDISGSLLLDDHFKTVSFSGVV